MMGIKIDMIKFSTPIKIYVFKDQKEVAVSFKVTETCVFRKWIKQEQFQYIMDNWREGVEGYETDMGKVWWSHRDRGPRPLCPPADFVAIDFGDWSFRITTKEMEELEKEFERQKITKNHWD